jgi:hypothetical protein
VTGEHDEGAIRFAYGLEAPEGDVAEPAVLQALAGWRAVLKRLALVGQDPARYGGQGFGNLSCRERPGVGAFVITASQTAGAEGLNDSDLVRVLYASPERFWVDAVGRQPPSSETLTHAAIYQADATVGCVLHAHSPDIWRRAAALALPATPEDVPYGSPEMAKAVALLLEQPSRPVVFVTLGHEDGVFACAANATAAANALVHVLARALS